MPPSLPGSAPSDLEAALRKFIEGRDLPLYRIMAYQMGWVSETGEPSGRPVPARPFGALAFAAAQAVGGDYRTALPHAVAVELADNFRQVHSDVQDGNTERAGRPSVWWTWGPAQAINAGDGIHAMARLALFQMQQDGARPDGIALALTVFDEAIVRLSEGEYLDISYQDRPVLSVDEYLKMAEARSGALAACALELGAISATASRTGAAGRMHEYGLKVGLARQVAGDIRALWGGTGTEPAALGRVVSKKKNLPVAHAMSVAEPAIRRKLGEIYIQRVLEPSAVKDVAALLDACGSRAFAQTTLTRLLAEADAVLASAGLAGEGAELLRATVREFVDG